MTDARTGREPHSTVRCVACGYDITPGDRREPTTDGTIHTVCRRRRDARDCYRFFLTPHDDGVSQSLFYVAGDREWPVCYNSGGVDVLSTADVRFAGDSAIRPTEHFIKALAYTYHWLLSYRPLPGDEDRIIDEIESKMPKYYPNEKAPDHEVWAAKLVLGHLYRSRVAPPEYAPIARCCDDVTAFRVTPVAEFGGDSR